MTSSNGFYSSRSASAGIFDKYNFSNPLIKSSKVWESSNMYKSKYQCDSEKNVIFPITLGKRNEKFY